MGDGMRFELQRSIVRPWCDGDREALVRHGNNRNVWLNLMDVFPHPYTDDDARGWIELNHEAEPPTHFAIEVDGEAVGGIGLTCGTLNARRTAEIGYWLGEPYWGRGILSEALPAVTRWGFAALDLCRIQAGVFEWNPASMRVLDKAGYLCEGRRRRSIVKDGQTIDQIVYARVTED